MKERFDMKESFRSLQYKNTLYVSAYPHTQCFTFFFSPCQVELLKNWDGQKTIREQRDTHCSIIEADVDDDRHSSYTAGDSRFK